MLISCKECGKQISSEAATCPHCGIALVKAAATPASETSKSKKWMVVVGVLLGLAALGKIVGDPKKDKPTPTENKPAPAQPEASPKRTPTLATGANIDKPASPKPQKVELPPDPPPPTAHKASEIPEYEAKLAADVFYQGIWEESRRADLKVLLTGVSMVLATGGLRGEPFIVDKKSNTNIVDPIHHLYLLWARQGSFPTDFTNKLTAYLAAVRAEPRLGIWAPSKEGEPTYDMTELAAWVMRDQPDYFREMLTAKRDGPLKWVVVDDKKAPNLAYLALEKDAIERLVLLAPLTIEEKARLEDLKRIKLGDRFTLGQFAYTIESVETASSVGKSFAKKKATEGASYVLVSYTIENLSAETQTVLADDFKIVDAKGREFRASSEANTALAMSGDSKDLILSELQPGLTRKMLCAFEIPEIVLTAGFTLVIPEKGLMGAGKVEIPFSIKKL